MIFGYIYKIQFPNGKHYIGLTTTSLEQRKESHKHSAKSGDTRILYNALRKYEMVDSFELVEIDTVITLEELREKEIGYILEYKSHYIDGNGYNMTYGGEGTNGYVFTEDDNKKNSERVKKYYEDNPDAGKEHGERMKKYYQDNPNAREKMSEIKNQYHQDNPTAGKEQGETLKKYYEDHPIARQKLSELKKKYLEEHPEARKKQYGIIKKYYEDNPDARSEIKKKYFEEHPNAGRENSERMKKYYEDNPDARQKFQDARGKNRPFDVFSLDGTLIGTFTYQFEAREYLQKEYNITSAIYITVVLSGKQKSSAGFVFKYKTI
jgi:hypothetical protein